MSTNTATLTDADRGIWLDAYRVSEADGVQLAGAKGWSVSKKTLRGGTSEGVDVVEIDNGALSVSILPTRGMGLWKGSYQNVPIGWRSPVERPVNPAFVNLTERSGLGWLAGFNELLCRCGLSWHGAPGLDVINDSNGNSMETPLTLHGKIANTPAHHVEISLSDDGPGKLAVTGTVDETMLFGPCLRLVSRVETEAGSNRLTILDRVTNIAGQPAEFELLYHTNLGPPFLERGSTFHAPFSQVAPSDPGSAKDIETWTEYLGPTAGYIEQCYFNELRSNEQGETLVLLENAAADKGLSLHFNRRQLPAFTLWKNTQTEADGYVTGMEPGTSLPNLKSFEREQGRIITLSPGESYDTRLELAVHIGKAAVAQTREHIERLAADIDAVVHPQPHPNFSPGA